MPDFPLLCHASDPHVKFLSSHAEPSVPISAHQSRLAMCWQSAPDCKSPDAVSGESLDNYRNAQRVEEGNHRPPDYLLDEQIFALAWGKRNMKKNEWGDVLLVEQVACDITE